MPVIDVITIKYVPVNDNYADRGHRIGFIGADQHIKVDTDKLMMNWVPIVGPDPYGPTWLQTGEQGWIKSTWYVQDAGNLVHYLLTLDKDNDTISITPVG